MAVAFQTILAVATTSLATVYTVPVGKVGVITGLQVTNIHATLNQSVNISITRGGVNGTDYYLVRNMTVPIKTSVSVLDGKFALQAGDIIKVQSTTASALHLIGTVMEQS